GSGTDRRGGSPAGAIGRRLPHHGRMGGRSPRHPRQAGPPPHPAGEGAGGTTGHGGTPRPGRVQCLQGGADRRGGLTAVGRRVVGTSPLVWSGRGGPSGPTPPGHDPARGTESPRRLVLLDPAVAGRILVGHHRRTGRNRWPGGLRRPPG